VQYGFSPLLGFFLTVFLPDGRRVVYDRSIPEYDDLRGFLDALVRAGVFEQAQVEDALGLLLVVEDLADIEEPEVRQIAVIISNLKQAASE
jgi:hypothetical protein